MRHGLLVVRSAAAAALCVALLPAPSPGANATFEVMGSFWAAGVSDDGNVVVGTWIDPALSRGQVIARWTPSDGLHTAGFVPSSEHTTGNGISGDGSTIVGMDYNSAALVLRDGEITYPTGGFGAAGGVNRDGSVVVGAGPTRWTAATGALPLPVPAGYLDGFAGATSADGSVVTGAVFDAPGNRQAFRWTAAGGTALPGLPPGVTTTEGTSVSADGSTVVGWAADAQGISQPFRWTPAGGLQLLGHLPGFPPPPPVPVMSSTATDVTADGSIVVGNDTVDGAFIWDAAHGMRDLKAVLESDYGLALAGWQLTAVGITPDGNTIIGMGSHPQAGNVAWRVVLPEPGSGAAGVGVLGLLLRRRRRA